MKAMDVLTNEFYVRYDEQERCVCIHTVHNGKEDSPIRIRLETLKGMDKDSASKWIGETIMLLVPSLRKELYGVDD